MIDQMLSGQLEALGVSSLSMRFTHVSGRSFPVVLTGKIVYEGDQLPSGGCSERWIYRF